MTNRRIPPSISATVAGVALVCAGAACAPRGEAPAQRNAADSVAPLPAPPVSASTRTTEGLRITLDSITRGEEYSLRPGWPPILRAAPGRVLALVHLTVTALNDGAEFAYSRLALEGSDGVRYDTGIVGGDVCSGPANTAVSCTLPISVPARLEWRALWYGPERFDVPQPVR